MFNQHGLFDDAAPDAWNERVTNNSINRNRFPEYASSLSQPSLLARTLLSPSSDARPIVEKKCKKQEQRCEPAEISYCDAYPNTNTNQVDWALYAAHRVAQIGGIELEKTKNNSTGFERNLATIFCDKCNGERFKNDQRTELLEKTTLQGILLAIFLPNHLTEYLNNVAAQHTRLKNAARQCVTQIEQYNAQLLKRAAQERDLLIKRMLFYADNNQTECTFTIDSEIEFGKNNIQWSQFTIDSVSEPDLFGRAIAVLVHQVLQSASLRVKAASCSDTKKIVLILSWKSALENLKADKNKEDAESKTERQKTDSKELGKTTEVSRKSVVTKAAIEKRAPYLSNPLFDEATFGTTDNSVKPNNAEATAYF